MGRIPQPNRSCNHQHRHAIRRRKLIPRKWKIGQYLSMLEISLRILLTMKARILGFNYYKCGAQLERSELIVMSVAILSGYFISKNKLTHLDHLPQELSQSNRSNKTSAMFKFTSQNRACIFAYSLSLNNLWCSSLDKVYMLCHNWSAVFNMDSLKFVTDSPKTLQIS